MAKKLTKDIVREALRVSDLKGAPVIVTLKAGDMLEFRTKGKRYRMDVPLQACYNLAMIYTANNIYRERMAKYIQDKKDGRRVKRPRPLAKVFNPKIYMAFIH